MSRSLTEHLRERSLVHVPEPGDWLEPVQALYSQSVDTVLLVPSQRFAHNPIVGRRHGSLHHRSLNCIHRDAEPASGSVDRDDNSVLCSSHQPVIHRSVVGVLDCVEHSPLSAVRSPATEPWKSHLVELSLSNNFLVLNNPIIEKRVLKSE